MHEVKGDKLYVNVGASQVRRRLKGFGHGVRKIETAGRHRAVIIHTALGRNLEALAAKFADVGYSYSDRELGEPIETLRNVGPTSAGWLRAGGVQTVADLEKLGPGVAYLRVKREFPQAPLNLLWALAAGLADVDWRELPGAERERLLANLGAG
jgi:DNA transformation protein